jgi:hypothetical protein
MELNPSFTLYLSYALLISLLIYTIGHIVFSFWNEEYPNAFESFFKKMVVGIIVLTTIYACLKTNFSTILSGIWVITGLYLIWNKRLISYLSIQKIKFIEWQAILYYLSGLLFLMAFFYYRVVNIDGFHKMVFLDNSFYAGIGDFLNKYGIESTSFNTIDIKGQGPSLYHFFNEWYMALIAKIFAITSLSAYSFIGLPIMWTIVFIGAVWISHQFFHKKAVIHWLISINVFFILGLGEYLQNLFFIQKGITFWDMNILNVGLTKLGIACILIISASMNLKDKLTINFFYPLAILSILYVTFSPTIFGATIIYFLYFKILKKEVYLKELLIISLSIVFIGLFYFINSFFSEKPLESYGILKHFGEYLKSKEFTIKPYLITFYATFIRFLIANLLYFSFFIFNKARFKNVKNFNKPLWIFLVGLLLTGYVMYVMLTFMADGTQFLTNPVQSFYIILLFTFLCYIISTAKKIDWVVLTIIVGFLFINLYRDYPYAGQWNLKKLNITYWIKLEKEFKGKEFSSVYLRKENSFKVYNHNLQIPAMDLRYITTSYYPISLGIFEMPPYPYLASKETDINSKTTSAFYRFVHQNKLINNVDSAKIQFIKKYKIDYLFIEKGNQWFENTKNHLPICYTIEDNQEAFRVIKLKW